jgi:signal transduction histidine kinase
VTSSISAGAGWSKTNLAGNADISQAGTKQIKSIMRVLLIEDNPDHAELIQEYLATLTHPSVSWEHADTLAGGVARAQAGEFDAVLLDLKLPDSDLGETVPRLVAQVPAMPIIVLTSLNDLDLGLRAVQQGAQDYLVKTQLSGELLIRSLHYAIERKRYANELQRYANDLQRSNEELHHFARTVAHEIRTPLLVVQILHKVLKQDYVTVFDPETVHLLEQAEGVVSSIQELVSDLLSFARIGGERNFQPVAVGEVVEEVLHNLTVATQTKGALIHYEDLPTVSADRTLLRQLFQNLIANALKYQEENTPELWIRAYMEDDKWVFSVQDNGIGFPPEDAQRIFRMFERAHDREKYMGTGIGLAFCKRIVEQHGGRIWAESKPGQGSTFYFTLPIHSINSF